MRLFCYNRVMKLFTLSRSISGGSYRNSSFMKKEFLILTVIVMIFPFSSAFADGSIEISTYTNKINTLDSIIVVGTITGASLHNPVTLTVYDPKGEILFKPSVTFGGDGKFSKLFHPPITGFEPGVYTVVASQKEVTQMPELQFTVSGASQNLLESQGLLSISADAVQGSTVIDISGITQSKEGDITVKVTAPNGNLVSVKQVTPSARGQFSLEIITGGPLWEQDGEYTVTAFQGSASEITDSVQVEIQDGVVVPEFGSLAMVILTVSIFGIILISSKFRNQILSQ